MILHPKQPQGRWRCKEVLLFL